MSVKLYVAGHWTADDFGRGGYCVVIAEDDELHSLFRGYETETDQAAMDFEAAIVGIREATELASYLELVTESAYLDDFLSGVGQTGLDAEKCTSLTEVLVGISLDWEKVSDLDDDAFGHVAKEIAELEATDTLNLADVSRLMGAFA